MKNLIKAINVYIDEFESDYAILLDGPWGSGKTFFVKNVLLDDLAKRGKKVVYISLFDKKSIDELISELSMHILNIYSNEYANKKASIFGCVLNSTSAKISSSNEVSSLNSIINKGLGVVPHGDAIKSFISNSAKNAIDYSKYIFIFDDYERCQIDNQELLGFINKITTQSKGKLIVVTDTSKIEENKAANYMEKVFGLTISYSYNFKEAVDDVIEKYAKAPEYRIFIKNKKNEILRVFSLVNSNNIRTVIFIIKRMGELYKLIDRLFNNNKDIYFHGFMEKVLMNVIVTSLEAREFVNKNYMSKYDSAENAFISVTSKGISNDLNKNKKSMMIEVNKFIDQYIYEYCIDDIAIEVMIRSYLNAAKNNFTKISQEINQLFYVSENEAANGLREVYQRISNNEYNLNIYPVILTSIFELSKILGEEFDTENLKRIILRNAENSVGYFNPYSWPKIKSTNDDADDFRNKLFKYLVEKNQKAEIKELKDYFINKEEFFKNKTRIFRYTEKRLKRGESVFEYIDEKIINNMIQQFNSKEISDFNDFLDTIYNNLKNEGEYKFDLKLFGSMNDAIANLIEIESDRIKKYHLRELLGTIEECSKILEQKNINE